MTAEQGRTLTDSTSFIHTGTLTGAFNEEVPPRDEEISRGDPIKRLYEEIS